MKTNRKQIRHVWVNPDRIKAGKTMVSVHGVTLDVDLGPFDFPSELIGTHDENAGQFRIDFRYLDDEPRSAVPIECDGLLFVEGVHSGKLISIIIPIDSKGFDNIGVIEAKLESAFSKRDVDSKSRSKSLTRQLNQRVAQEVIKEELLELVGQ